MKLLSRLGLCGSLAWRMLRVSLQMLYGAWRISKLKKPIVSIFGGARLTESDDYFQKAHQLASRLAEAQISVLTGGGPGIMEAASCGVTAVSPHEFIMGISVSDLGEGKNPCVQNYFELDYFFARKWLLTRYSVGFVVFPGGFGTLDELSEALTLMQTNKLDRVPVVLFGCEYWEPFMYWLRAEALQHGIITQEDFDLFTVTDDLEEVFCLIRDECAF